jgi:hypothetical protein
MSIIEKLIQREGKNLYVAALLLSNDEKEAREAIEQIADVALANLYAKTKRLSLARLHFECYCNHSIGKSVDELEGRAMLNEIQKIDQNIYGRTVFLFNDGSSIQYCGFNNELKVVD